jgi:hypothetical protein
MKKIVLVAILAGIIAPAFAEERSPPAVRRFERETPLPALVAITHLTI